MKNTLRAKTLSITVGQKYDVVFAYLAVEENLPRWNRGLCRALRKHASGWDIDSPFGPASFRFVRDDRSGVLDQRFELSDDSTLTIPMRVLANGEGAEIVLTLLQAPRVSDVDFQKMLSRADQGLRDAKRLLEQQEPEHAEISVEEAEEPAIGQEPVAEPGTAFAPERETGAATEAAESPASASRLYIGNLPYDWTEEMLREHFAPIAPVRLAQIARMGRSGRSRGFGFIEMENPADTQKAIEQLHGSAAGSRRITVRLSRPKTEKPAPIARPAAKAPAVPSRSHHEGRSKNPRGRSRPAPRRGRPAPSRRSSGPIASESAHIDQEETVLETGGYYFVPRRSKGSETPPEEVTETLSPRPHRRPRRG